MKKLLAIIISTSVVFVLAFSFNIFAGDMAEGIGNNELNGSSESFEMLEDMELILSDVEEFDIYQDDIDLTRAVRVYPVVDIFREEIKSPDEMKDAVSGAEYYVYIIPIDTTEPWYSLTVAPGAEIRDYSILDEEGIKYLEERVGRWGVTEVSEYEGQPDYFEDYQKKMDTFCEFYGIEDSETFFIGGTTTNSISIAVCFPNDGSQGAYYIAMEEFPLNPQSIEEIKGAVYTFDEMKEYAIDFTSNEFESESGNENETMYFGGRGSGSAYAEPTTSPWIYVIIAVVVCAAVVVTVIAIRRHRSKA